MSITPATKARSQTSSSLLFLPWVIFYVLMIGLAWLMRGNAVFLAVVLWPVLMIGLPLWQIKRARGKLLAEFRLRALERYSALPAHPWWAKAGRFCAQLWHQSKASRPASET